MQILLESGGEEGAARVARAATERYSHSVAAWSLRLQTLVQLESADVSELFQDAVSHVNPKVLRAMRCNDSTLVSWFSLLAFTCSSASIIVVVCVKEYTQTHTSSSRYSLPPGATEVGHHLDPIRLRYTFKKTVRLVAALASNFHSNSHFRLKSLLFPLHRRVYLSGRCRSSGAWPSSVLTRLKASSR